MTTQLKLTEDRLHRLILAPVLSEKSNRVSERHNQAVFRVLRDASKPEIKVAVEALFNVSVLSVQTMNCAGKTRRTARGVSRRPDWKKAYVTLAEGQQIDFLGGSA